MRIKRFKLNGTIYTISKELNALKGKVLAPEKLKEANAILSQLKTPLPQ